MNCFKDMIHKHESPHYTKFRCNYRGENLIELMVSLITLVVSIETQRYTCPHHVLDDKHFYVLLSLKRFNNFCLYTPIYHQTK